MNAQPVSDIEMAPATDADSAGIAHVQKKSGV